MRINKISIILLAAILLVGCGDGKENQHAAHEKEVAEDVHDDHESHDGEIFIGKDRAKQLGIKAVAINPGKFRSVLNVSGEILLAQGAQKLAVAKTSGIVTFASMISEGTDIRKGGLICSISASGMQGGSPNTSAKIAYETAKAEYERLKPLYEEKLATAREFKEAKEAYELAENAYLGARGGNSVASPLSGIVDRLLVENGSYVDAGTPVASVSENRRLTLRAYVPQKYYSEQASVQSANFKLSYSPKVYSLSALDGRRVSSGSMAVSTTDRGYTSVSFDFDNAGGIVPGSYAEVYLLGQERSNVLSIPLAALTEEMGYYFVYVEREVGAYEKCRVMTGACDGINIEVVSGLKKGDNVVVEGGVLVKIAANSSVVPEGHHH